MMDVAAKRIVELEGLISEYKSTSHKVESAYIRDENVISFRLTKANPLPLEMEIVAGEVVAKYRSILDYLLWQLVIANGQTPAKQQFPIFVTPADFRKCNPKWIEGISVEAMAIIESLQPYHHPIAEPNECHALAILHELTNISKHRFPISLELDRYKIYASTGPANEDDSEASHLDGNLDISISTLDRDKGIYSSFEEVRSVLVEPSMQGQEICRLNWVSQTMSEPKPSSSLDIDLVFGPDAGWVRGNQVIKSLRWIENYFNRKILTSPGLIDHIRGTI